MNDLANIFRTTRRPRPKFTPVRIIRTNMLKSAPVVSPRDPSLRPPENRLPSPPRKSLKGSLRNEAMPPAEVDLADQRLEVEVKPQQRARRTLKDKRASSQSKEKASSHEGVSSAPPLRQGKSASSHESREAPSALEELTQARLQTLRQRVAEDVAHFAAAAALETDAALQPQVFDSICEAST